MILISNYGNLWYCWSVSADGTERLFGYKLADSVESMFTAKSCLLDTMKYKITYES